MITRYGFKDAISGFFEFPTNNARRILPAGLEPVEVYHGTSVLAVTVFDFDESEVGAYGEVCYAVLVIPYVKDGRIPRAAEYPWQVATTTTAARMHAIERLRLPHCALGSPGAAIPRDLDAERAAALRSADSAGVLVPLATVAVGTSDFAGGAPPLVRDFD